MIMPFHASRSLQIEPTAEVYHGLGALLFNSDRVKEAKEMFEQLLRMDPDHMEGICGYVSDNKYFILATTCLGLVVFLEVA